MFSQTAWTKADQWQPLQSIREAAEAHVKKDFTEKAGNSFTARAGKLDNRLKLALCQSSLLTKTHGKRQSTQQVVAVRCEQPNWKIYVVVKTVHTQNILVAKNRLNRGDIIAAEDIELSSEQTDRLRNGWYTRADQVVGRTLKRGLNPGQPLSGNHLQKKWLIKRNQRVKLVASAKGLTVAMQGKALANASLHEAVRVKNLSSGKTVEGVVISAGVVQIH